MPLIKPFGLEDNLISPPQDTLDEILDETGIATKNRDNDKETIRSIFDRAGAGIDDIARTVAYTMKNGDNDSACLKAAEIAMKVQGIIAEINENSLPEININITGSDNKTLINLVIPKGN